MKVSLGDSVPEAMIKLSIGSIIKQYNKSDIETKFSLAPKLSDEELDNHMNVLRGDVRLLRGKFEIQFLHKFFEYLNSDASSHRREYTVLTHGVNMDRPRMISTLDHYVATPQDKRYYIINGVRQVA